MVKKGFVGILVLLLTLGMATVAFAADDSAKMASALIFASVALACGFGIAIAAWGTATAMGKAITAAMEGTARNPEAGGKIMTTMIIGLALVEALCIYALLVCLMMVGKIPSIDSFIG